MKAGTFSERLFQSQDVKTPLWNNPLLRSETSDAIEDIHFMLQDCH